MSAAAHVDPPTTETCAYCGGPTYMGPCASEDGVTVWPACCVKCVDKLEPVPRTHCDAVTLAEADMQLQWSRSQPFWHNMHCMGRRRRPGD